MPSAKPAVQFRVRISKGDDIAIGPGKVDLLEAIGETGSITSAAKRLGMSYRRAWLLIDTMNRCFKNPIVEAEAGGRSGGGTRLTATGRVDSAMRGSRRFRRGELDRRVSRDWSKLRGVATRNNRCIQFRGHRRAAHASLEGRTGGRLRRGRRGLDGSRRTRRLGVAGVAS